MSKLFTKKFNHLSPLTHAFNIKNTRDLIWNLNETSLLPHNTLASLDITNLYPNIPVTETKTIFTNMFRHEFVELQTEQEILSWYDFINKQNYLSHNKNIIIQQDDLAMCTPSSRLIAAIFLQHLENLHLAHLAHKHHIVNYFRYVDDIFLIFDSNNTCIQNLVKDFNTLRPIIHTYIERYKTNNT